MSIVQNQTVAETQIWYSTFVSLQVLEIFYENWTGSQYTRAPKRFEQITGYKRNFQSMYFNNLDCPKYYELTYMFDMLKNI